MAAAPLSVTESPARPARRGLPGRLRRIGAHLAIGVVQLAVVSFAVFLLLDVAPGDVAFTVAGENASEERVAEVREALGLDQHVVVRYVEWVGDVVTGDLGASLVTGETVIDALQRSIPPTASMMVVSLTISIVVSMVAGTVAALKPNGLVDRAIVFFAGLGVAVPSFVLAMVLVAQLALANKWFPAVGYEPLSSGLGTWLRHLILPSIALSLVSVAEATRQLRGALIDVFGTDYVLAARAKGMRRHQIVFKHALKNAIVPVITVLGVRVSQLIGGTVILESIFNIRGLGTLAVGAANRQDIPLVMGVVMITTIVVIITGLLVELAHPYFDPRLRGARAKGS